MNIIIIGAGIAGLTAAHTLKQQGHRITIYERSSKLRNIGGGFLIYPHGIGILKALGFDELIKAVYTPLTHIQYFDENNQLLLRDSLDGFYNQTQHFTLPMPRTDLQQYLAGELDSHELKLNHTCTSISESLNKVMVEFANGETASADLVIGADGIRSTVRKQFFKEYKTRYCGISFWGSILPADQICDADPDTLSFLFSEGRTSWIAPIHSGQQMFYISVRMPEQKLDQGSDKLSQLSELCRDWHPWIDQILAAPQNDNHFAFPVRELEVNEPWYSRRVVLIGDAAHAFGPVTGQGCALALEDAYCLAHCVKEFPILNIALEQYQHRRKKLTTAYHEVENTQQLSKVSLSKEVQKERNAYIKEHSATELLQGLSNLITTRTYDI